MAIILEQCEWPSNKFEVHGREKGKKKEDEEMEDRNRADIVRFSHKHFKSQRRKKLGRRPGGQVDLGM